MRKEQQSPRPGSRAALKRGGGASSSLVEIVTEERAADDELHESNNNSSLNLGAAQRSANSNTTTTTTTPNNNNKIKNSGASAGLYATTTPNTTSTTPRGGKRSSMTTAPRQKRRGSNNNTTTAVGGGSEGNHHPNNNNNTTNNNSASTAKGPVSGGGGNNKDMLQSTVRSVAGGVPHYQLHTSASRGASRSLSSTHVRMGFAGRPMAPVVHIRVRPLLPFMGESNDLRRVWFLDHKNMVVRAAARVTDRRQTLPPSKLSPGNSTAAMHPSGSGTAALKGTANNSSLLLGGGGGSSFALHSPYPYPWGSHTSRAESERSGGSNQPSRSSSPRRNSSCSPPQTSISQHIAIPHAPAGGVGGGKGSQCASGWSTPRARASTLSLTTFKNSSSTRAAAPNTSLASPTQAGKNASRSSEHSTPKHSASCLHPTGAAGGRADSGRAAATAAGPPPADEVGASCGGTDQHFTFEFIHDEEASQEEVFDESILRFADEALLAQNISILCYGPTGSGKTYSMMGNHPAASLSRRGSTAAVVAGFPLPPQQHVNPNNNNISCTPSPTHARTPSRGGAAGVRRATMPLTPEVDALTPLTAALGGDMGIAALGEDRVSSRRSSSYSVNGKPYGSSASESFTPVSDEDEDEEWPLFDHTWYRNRRHQMQTAAKRQDEAHLMNAGNTTDMGILPRLVRVLLDKRGETLVLEREGLGSASNNSSSNVSSSTGSRTRGGGTTTTTAASRGGGGGTMASSATAVVPRRKMSLTLDELTFYGIEIYVDELFDLMDPGKRPVHNVSDTGGLASLCIGLNEARAKAVRAAQAAAAQHNRNRTATATTAVPPRPTGGGIPIESVDDLRRAYKLARKNRVTSVHARNDTSSRSHAVFILQLGFRLVEEDDYGDDVASAAAVSATAVPSRSRRVYSYVALVDLAGCERIKETQVEGAALREAQYINKSLSALSSVVLALYQRSAHIPYRDSKLTRLLRPCLEGGRVLILVHVAPCSAVDTMHSLKFADQVRHTLVQTHSFAGDSNKRGLRDLFEDLIDPAQGRLEVALGQSQHKLDQLCAEVRLAYLTRTLLGDSFNLGPIMGSASTASGNRSRPREDALDVSFAAPSDQLSMESSMTTPAEPAVSTSTVSPNTDRFPAMPAASKRAYAIRTLVQGHFSPLWASEEDGVEEAIREMKLERDRRVEAARRRTEEEIVRIKSTIDEMSKYNARLAEENASPIPRDPYCLELSKEVKVVNEELLDASKVHQTLQSLVALLRQRVSMQSEIDEGVSADVEEMRQKGLLPPAPGTHSCSSPYHNKNNAITGSPPGTAALTYLQSGVAADAEMREIGCQQVLLSKELSALRLEAACFELGDGIWEGLWARTMRQEFLTAMRVEQALVERVLLDKAALEMVVGDTSSMLSSPTTKSMLPHSASAQSVDRPRRGSLSSATLLSLSTNNNHNTATASSPLELRERVQAYLDNRPRRPSDSDSIDVFVHATSSAASGGFHHSHRTFNNNTEFNNSTGNNAATAAAAAAAISAGSSPKLSGSTQTAGTATAAASNTTGGFVCIPNPLQELVTLSAAVNRGEAAEGDSDVLLPPKTANSMLTSPSSSLGQQQNTTTTNTNTNTNNNTTAHNRSSQPPSAARPLSQMPVAQNAAPFVNCYDDEEAMQRVGVKILLEEGIPCEVCCIGDGFESVYTQYLCPVMESGKGTSKQKGEAAASPRGVANEDDVGCEDTEERSDPDLHSHNEDANGKDTHTAPAPMLTSRWGRLRLVRRPRGDGRGRRGGSASGCGGGDDEEGYSYCLEFVFSHRGIPLPPRVREGVIAAAAPHHPRTELEELVDALPVPLDLRRGTTTPASTAVQQSLKEHRLFSIPLDESQLSVDLHLLEAGTTRATPVRIGAHREVIRRTEKDAQVAMELHGVPLSTGSPLTSRAMQNLRAQHATAAAARSISRCSASVPRGGGGGGGTDGADGGAEDAPSSTAYSAAPYHPAGDIVVAKRLMDGGELLLPTSCIVPNKGVCTLLLRFSNRTTSNATRLEAVETIIAGLSGIMPPAVPSAPQQQQQQQQQSAASNGIVPLINGTADVAAAAPTPVTRTRSHSGGGGHHHRRTSSTSSRSGQCKRTMSLSVCERTTGGMDRMVCMYPHVPYILLYPSSTQAGERSSDLSRKKLKPSPSAASHDGEPAAVVTGKPTTVVAAGTDDVVVRGSSPEPVRPPGASATISSAAPVSYYKAPSEADTPLSSNTMVRGTGLQVHLHFPGRLTATATTTTISGGGAGSRSRSRAASTAPDATSASASSPTTTEKESTSQYIHYAAATLLQLRSVTVGPFDDTTGGGGGVVGGAPHHRTVTRLGMLLQQLHAFRRSIRAMVKQQIYEAEDIKGDVAMHSSEREMLQGSHHLRDVQLEARQAVGLQVHMTASPPGSYDQHHHHQQSVPRPSTNMLESGGGGGIADLRSEVHLSLGRELCSFMVPWTIWQWAHRWPAVERRYRELEAEMLAATGGGGGGVTEGGLFTPGGPQQHSHHHGGGGSSAALLSTAAVTGGSAWSTVALGSPAMDATTESDDELTYSFEYGKWMDESALASINVAPRTVWLPEVSFAQVPSYLAYLHRHHYGHHALTAVADEDC